MLAGSLAAAGVTAWELLHTPPPVEVVTAPLPPAAPTPRPAETPPAAPVIAARAPRTPVLTPLGESAAPYGFATWLPVAPAQRPERGWPLLLTLHGQGENGNGRTQFERTWQYGPGRMIADGSTWFDEVVVVAPQSTEIWKRLDVDAFITYLLASDLRIDPDRIYLTGISSGGGLVWWYSLANGARLAAAVPICGALSGPPTVAFKKRIPIWAIHGANDTLVPPEWTIAWSGHLAGVPAPGQPGRWLFADGVWQLSPGDPPPEAAQIMTLAPGQGHDCWTQAYGDPALWRWLFAQRRGGPPKAMSPATGKGQ